MRTYPATVSAETMNKPLAEIAARYGTARAFERLLERVGWMKDGFLIAPAVYVTDGEVTPRGQGYLDEASREKSR
jgi:hypothetical protein